MTIDQINQLIQSDLDATNLRLKKELKSDVSLLNMVVNHILKSKGKQIRPLMICLMARICGTLNDSSILAAAMIELLHTATLVHDDVVDESDMRRGLLSINAKWKNKTAILVGDFMLSKGLLIALDNNEFELLKIMSEAVKDMSEGELLQIEKAKRLDITEEVYYEIISKKTASLIKTACRLGCKSVSEDSELLEICSKIGYHIGMAFQLKDDLLDLGRDDIGKPLAIDIKEQKMTLPLIYTLKQISTLERLKLLGLIKFKSKSNSTINTIIDTIEKHGGLEYTQSKMKEHSDLAKQYLTQCPQNTYTEALFSLIDYTIERKK